MLASVALFAPGTAARGSEPPPNIIVILADDLGYHDLGSYGQRDYPTPHTDRLAREGMRFTDAHSPNAVCSPTRYAVLTGTDPHRRYHTSHVLFNGEPLVIGPREPTVASLLQKRGYATGVVGKWHLGLGDALPRDLNTPGRGPNEVGFDYSYILPDGPDMKPNYYMENGRIEGAAPGEYLSAPAVTARLGYHLVSNEMVGTWADRRPPGQMGARLASQAVAFIERNRRRPFFLYFPTPSIHLPHTPDPRFAGRSGQTAREDYVMEFDWSVGQVMAALDRLGLAERTLLFVTSDNGGQLQRRHREGSTPSVNHPWRGGKGEPWEGGHRIPLLVRWPGRIQPDVTSDATVSLVDLPATAAAAAGVSLPADAALDSFNLLPALRGERASGDAVRPSTTMSTRGIGHLILREGPWKLIHSPEKGDSQLYHLGDDPGEQQDRAAAEPARVAALREVLSDYFRAGASRPGAQAPGKEISDLFREREERNRLVAARLEQAAQRQQTDERKER